MSAASVDEVLGLFERWGADPYDEEVSQIDHALQTAAHAVAAGVGEPLIAAALLHDVGHLLDRAAGRGPGATDLRHEDVGAAWLRPLFPTSVTAPIALHVRAKRYLCTVDPDYARLLSAGSVRSLALQGGRMTVDDAAAFEQLSGGVDAVALRRWDDAGKVDGQDVPGLDTYAPLLRRWATRAPID